jgi:hypothetical protein
MSGARDPLARSDTANCCISNVLSLARAGLFSWALGVSHRATARA